MLISDEIHQISSNSLCTIRTEWEGVKKMGVTTAPRKDADEA